MFTLKGSASEDRTQLLIKFDDATLMKKILILLTLIAVVLTSEAQVVSIKDAIDIAIKNNPGVRAAISSAEAQRQLRRTSFDLPKTEIVYMRGQYNSYSKDDNNISIMQSIPFAALGSHGALNRANVKSAELKQIHSENELTYEVKQVYYQLSFLKARRKLLQQQDSLFEGFYKSASLRFKTGEANLLEQTTAESQRNESKNAIFQIESDILVLREQLKSLLNANELPDTPDEDLSAIPFSQSADSLLVESNPSLALARQQVVVSEAGEKVAAARFAPDLLIGYFNQTLIGTIDPVSGDAATRSDRFSGFQVGLALPLWFVPHHARVKAAKHATVAARSEYENHQLQVNANIQQAIRAYDKHKRSLEYYQNTGLPNALLIIKQSKTAFREGEADYTEYLLGIKNAISIQENYLNTLNNFNQTIIYLEFLSGNK
jgi:cobalt-zinc-cadmium resistance protein CzcA